MLPPTDRHLLEGAGASTKLNLKNCLNFVLVIYASPDIFVLDLSYLA